MSISQAKIDLAVLWKLFQHFENGGEAVQTQDVRDAFSINLPNRRIELALEQLQSQGDVVKGYDRYAEDELNWQITREGLTKVERALRVPTSFTFRLNANGEKWLESDDAKKAVLKSLVKSNSDVVTTSDQPNSGQPHININNVFSPTSSQAFTANHSNGNDESGSSVTASWISAWGSWAAVALAILALIATLWIAGKI